MEGGRCGFARPVLAKVTAAACSRALASASAWLLSFLLMRPPGLRGTRGSGGGGEVLMEGLAEGACRHACT